VAGGNVRSPRQIPPRQQRPQGRVGWKWERVSASERHGTVKCNPRSAVDAGEASACGRWGPPPGLSTRTKNPAGLSSRTPTPTPVTPSELGHATRRSAPAAETPTGPTLKDRAHRRGAGPQRIVDQAKARGNARDTGVVPGCHATELNSTIAEEVTVPVGNEGHSRKAC
jgi:hypothetical protein